MSYDDGSMGEVHVIILRTNATPDADGDNEYARDGSAASRHARKQNGIIAREARSMVTSPEVSY